jgi:hypothetical protein
MSGHRKTALVALAGAAVSCSLGLVPGLAPAAFAGTGSALDGHYMVTFSANQKTGTSAAARQPESAQWAKYAFTSSCSTGGCVAKVSDSPASTSLYAQQSGAYTWNGSQWVEQMTSKYDCPLVGGLVEHDPARSITALTPGPNGALTGVFHTDIVSGACKGTVEMPVTATPYLPPVV